MYKLIITEKPSVAQSIAAVLGAQARKTGYIEGNGYLVSWCIGHLATLASADVYDKRYAKWIVADLPIVPEHWRYVVPQEKQPQFLILRDLMHRADVEAVINACDAGREGELIFRNVYTPSAFSFAQEDMTDAGNLEQPPAPQLTTETVAVYPAEENHLPYDVVVERLHSPQPEPDLDESLDEHPISIPVDGAWQTFPNVAAAEKAAYGEYKENLRRNAQNFRITDEHLGEGGPKAKYQTNISAIKLLKYLEAEGQQASAEQ